METIHENNFKEYLILKTYAIKTGASVQEIRKLSDRTLRAHLMAVHGEGQPLSEITDYLLAFYSIFVTPQQLKKILKLTDGNEWKSSSESYQQHRLNRRHQKAISALG